MPYKLSLADQNPALLRPLGDRYLVALIETDDTVQMGTTAFVIARPLKRDDKGREIPGSDLEDIGWKVGVVVSRGDGVLPDAPVQFLTLTDTTAKADIDAIRAGVKEPPAGASFLTESCVVVAQPPMVAMQYHLGDVLFIERFAGRDILLQGKKYCIISQAHVLLKHPTLTLEPDDENGWRSTATEKTSLAAV